MSAKGLPQVVCVGPARLTAGFREFGRLDLWAQSEVHGDPAPISFDG